MPTLTELRAQLCAPVPPADAAVLVPLVRLSSGPALLYEVRSGSVHQPGEICFPGGRVEPGENPVDTALAGGRRVQPVVGTLPAEALQEICPADAEVASFFTVPLAWLRAHPARWYSHVPGAPAPDTPPILQGFFQHYDRTLRTRYWEYDSHGIWGLTARITQSLLDTL